VSQADPDVTATIAALVVYPVKSCSGVPVNEAVLTEAGLDLDRPGWSWTRRGNS
jgi:hypothetical protein